MKGVRVIHITGDYLGSFLLCLACAVFFGWICGLPLQFGLYLVADFLWGVSVEGYAKTVVYASLAGSALFAAGMVADDVHNGAV